MSIVRSVTFVMAAAVLPLAPLSGVGIAAAQQADRDGARSPSAFVALVRQATEPFRDVANVPAGYGAALGCVSGPERGAMGVHFVNGELVGDALLDATRPEALLYEFKDGRARLVGVEFIMLADVWHQTHPPNDPPILEGQLLHLVESPNRFGLPTFYELHVWAWRDNPDGAFVDWNSRISCEGQ